MRAGRVDFGERRFVLEAVVFTAAAVGMVLELAGSRLMAPHFGNSLFVWTSLIGVILAFMSLGNYVGGRLADRWLDVTMLSWVLGIGALGVVITSFSEGGLLPALAGLGPTRAMSVVAACVLFAVPAVLLGVVTPYSIRLRMHGLEHAGATVGRLYALATIGSIAGTFAAGFWLLSIMGTHNLILLCVVVLVVLAALLMGRPDWRKLALLVIVVTLAGVSWSDSESGDVTLDTQYDRYMLRTLTDAETGRMLVGLSRDFVSAESASFADTGEPYAFDYYDYYDLAVALHGNVSSALTIGGGTFSYPRIFLAQNPGATMDVVEIDGDLVEVAERHFGYSPDPRMPLFLEDGRTFLNRAAGPYDVLLMDAFKSESTVPYQLTTVESWRRCYAVLADDGILVMNVVASPTDDRQEFFHALVASISEVFPRVEVYEVQGPGSGSPLENTSIVAVKRAEFDLAAEVARVRPDLATNRMEGYQVPPATRRLTDDFAPVDQYLLGI